jgi:hypothetical protein
MNPEAGWYPVRLERRADGEIMVHWQDLKSCAFTEPFFEDTLRFAGARRMETRETSLQALGGISLPVSTAPTAFFFHTSRSGSTLLTQLLSIPHGSLALSEPPILDELLQFELSDEIKVVILRQLIIALGQRRCGSDRYFFLKCDSWHIAWFPLIRRGFPNTPCYFVYRHPVEILRSHHRQRGSQMVPGLRSLGRLVINPQGLSPGDLDGYTALVLKAIFLEALPFVEMGSLIPLVHHQLIHSLPEIFRLLNLDLSSVEQEQIRQRSRYHSKRKEEIYQADLEPGIPSAIELRLQRLAAPELLPVYQKLEDLSHR